MDNIATICTKLIIMAGLLLVFNACVTVQSGCEGTSQTLNACPNLDVKP